MSTVIQEACKEPCILLLADNKSPEFVFMLSNTLFDVILF
jgi:hypothetical protein